MIYTLRREFGMSARDAFALPHWELTTLMAELNQERKEQEREAKKADRR